MRKAAFLESKSVAVPGFGCLRGNWKRDTAGPSTTLRSGRDDNSAGPLTLIRLIAFGAISLQQNCHPDRSVAQWRDLLFLFCPSDLTAPIKVTTLDCFWGISPATECHPALSRPAVEPEPSVMEGPAVSFLSIRSDGS